MSEPSRNGAQDRTGTRLIRLFMFSAILALVVAVAAFGVTALLVNIFERKQEARNPFFRVVELTDETEDPAVWGKNFPMQYDLYTRTVDMQRTRYGAAKPYRARPPKRIPGRRSRSPAWNSTRA